ncbi:hypothetical protein D3C84_783810 [compost metagenome]
MQEQKRQRRHQKHQARQAGQEVHHRVGVTDALEEGQALSEQGVVGAEDLRHATGPANALADMR